VTNEFSGYCPLCSMSSVGEFRPTVLAILFAAGMAHVRTPGRIDLCQLHGVQVEVALARVEKGLFTKVAT